MTMTITRLHKSHKWFVRGDTDDVFLKYVPFRMGEDPYIVEDDELPTFRFRFKHWNPIDGTKEKSYHSRLDVEPDGSVEVKLEVSNVQRWSEFYKAVSEWTGDT
jgi:hypothetical protein